VIDLDIKFEAVSNRADWITDFEVVTDETETPVDITGASIAWAVRDKKTKSAALTATVDNGIIITDAPGGRFTVSFDDSQMRALCPATYDVGCTILLNGTTDQLFVGTVSVIDGIVP
jgi:hypothetical protein